MACKFEVKMGEIKHEINPFGLMKVKVSKHLTKDIQQDMCTLLEIEPAVTENIKRGMDILTHMQERGSLGPRNVNLLKDMLHALDVQTAVKEVETYIRHYVSDEDKVQTHHADKKSSEDISQQQKAKGEWQSYENNIEQLECAKDSFQAYDKLPNVLNFVLVGRTGCGKSATGNNILDRRYFIENCGSCSQTKTISFGHVKEGERFITLVDTPGFFDTNINVLIHRFQHQWLCLEIAKTALRFPEGIHLFLIIYNPLNKFTQEEEATIKHIEEVLERTVYDNCVLIFTHAKSKFQKLSLKKFLETEKQQNGKLSELITAVNDQVIAIENSFEETLMHSEQRNHLLTRLAEIVYRNKGSSYQHQLFIEANKKLEDQIRKRQGRFNKTQERLEVNEKLQTYLYDLLMTFKLTSDELKKIEVYFRQNIRAIMQFIETKHFDEGNAQCYWDNLVRENETIIKDCIKVTMLRDEAKERIAQKFQDKINEEEVLAEMKEVIISFVDKVIRRSSPDRLKLMQVDKALPPKIFNALIDKLKDKKCFSNIVDVKKFVRKTFFENPSVVQEIINKTSIRSNLISAVSENLESSKAKLEEKCKAEERVHKYFTEFTRHELSSGDRQNLKKKLLERQEISSYIERFITYVQRQNCALTKQVCTEYFNTRAVLICNILDYFNAESNLLIETKDKTLLKQRMNETLRIISDIINERLKRYLTGTSVEKLKEIDGELASGKVPENISREILHYVFEDLKLAMEPSTIGEEILLQLRCKRDIVDDLIKEAERCFPDTCKVSSRFNSQTPIASLKVGDEVLVYDSKGNLKYERVYLLTHANRETKALYIEIVTQKGKVFLISPNHYLPINSLHNLLPAKDAAVYQSIFSVIDGVLTSDVIVAVSKKICKGAFCPMTMNGTIVVNDVAASCFTTIFNPTIGHALLFPVRVMYSYLPKSIFSTLIPYDQVEGMPIIFAKCRSAITFFAKLF